MPTLGDITTRTLMNSYLKVAQKKLTKQFNDATVLLNMIQKKTGTLTAGGRTVELPQHVFPNRHAAGVRGDAGAWAKASVGKRANAQVEVYPMNMTGSFGEIAEMRTEQQVQSLESVVQATIKDINLGFPQQVNKHLFLGGRGVWARVNGVPNQAAGTFIVHDEMHALAPTEFGAHYLEEGMWCHATSDNTLTDPDRGNVDFQITNVSTLTVTAEGSIQGLQNNDYIVAQDALNNITHGLFSGCSDGTTAPAFASTYMNIDRTAAGNSYWQASCANLGAAGIIEEAMIARQTAIAKRNGMIAPVAITTFEVINKIFIQAKSDANRNFIVNVGKNADRKYGMGFSGIDMQTQHGEMTLFGDKDCPKGAASSGEMFLINPPDWFFAQVGTPGWTKNEGGGYIHNIPETYQKKANWKWVFSLYTNRPLGQGRISNLIV